MKTTFTKHLKIISDIVKALKTEYVYLYDGIALGINIDKNNSPIYYCDVDINTNGRHIFYNCKHIAWLNKIVKETKEEFMIDQDWNIYSNHSVIKTGKEETGRDKEVVINTPIVYPNIDYTQTYINSIIIDKLSKIVMMSQMKPVYVDNNAMDKPEVQSFVDMKSGDGAKIYWIEKYPVLLFSSILPINKGDTLSLTLYDNDIKSFIGKISVNKPKSKLVINICVRYQKL